MKYFLCALSFVVLTYQCRSKEPNYDSVFPGKQKIPTSIKNEHEHLLNQIHTFTLFQDRTGRLALKLDSLMQHHFQEEEDFVLPPLGCLPSLAGGEILEQSKEVIQLTHMSFEHQLIKAYLSELIQAAAMDSHPEIISFEKEVHKHSIAEEEVFFPASILSENI